MHAQLLQGPRDFETRRPLFDDEQVVARVPTLALVLGDNERPVTARTVGDEGLAPVDDELVPETPSHRRDARHVRARIGLGDRDRGNLLSTNGGRQPPPLLLLGAELEHRRGRHLGLYGDGHAQPAAAGSRQLLGEDERREVVAALAAVLRRVAQAQKTELPEAPEDRVWEGLFLPLVELRLDFLFE